MGLFQKAKDKASNSGKAMLNYEQVSSVGGWIKQSAKSLSPWRKKAGVRVETFQAAIERMAVSEEDLAKQYQNHVLRFYLALLVWTIGTIVTGIYLARGSWISLLPYGGFTALCGAQLFSASLWAMQIRRREFVGAQGWLALRGEWFPTELELPPPPAKKSGIKKSRGLSVAKDNGKPKA